SNYAVLALAVGVGGAIGALLAARVAMTAMPELVAILHSFVGLAAVLVGFGSYLSPFELGGAEAVIHEVEVAVGVFVGAVTLTGSGVGCGGLRAGVRSRALLVPGRHWLNFVVVVACIALSTRVIGAPHADGVLWLAVQAVLAGLLGIHLVMAIGGADMPVVVSMLNSYSGCAAAAAGVMVSDDRLILTRGAFGSLGA